MEKYKSQIIFIGVLCLTMVVFFYWGAILLPFIVALLLAYLVNPIVVKIQRVVPNRNIAVTLLLLSSGIVFIGTLFIFGAEIVNDFKRLNNAFTIFAEDNKENIDHTTYEVKSFIQKIYPIEEKTGLDLENQVDSVKLDTETVQESIQKISSFFSSNGDEEVSNRAELNWFLVILYALIYFFSIIYTYPYFESRFLKYVGTNTKHYPYFDGLIHDFKTTFITYFQQRIKVVLICTLFFLVSFLIMGIPGALLIGTLAGLLCLISHFHYLALIPLSLSCWAYSVEQNQSFFLYFGIILGLFVLVSVFEELIFFPKIMKGVSNMNPAIMMISLTFWGYVFGFFGVLIALPLTTVLLLFVKRLLLKNVVNSVD